MRQEQITCQLVNSFTSQLKKYSHSSKQETLIDMQNHKDLIVWKKSMEHVTNIYKVTRDFPKDEIFGIVSQMRRAAVSIPSNISEGYGRLYGKETMKFLSNARGSASELETQIIISRNLGFAADDKLEELQNQIAEILRMLSALIKTVE